MEAKARHPGVIKRNQVRVDEARPSSAPRAAPGVPSGSAPGGAAVRLVQVDENTQAIEFTCSCGEVSLIEIRTEKKP